MRRMLYLLMLAAIPAALIWSGGCSYESRSTTVYEPGVYKGKEDPLLALQNRQELINRFKLVQTDR